MVIKSQKIYFTNESSSFRIDRIFCAFQNNGNHFLLRILFTTDWTPLADGLFPRISIRTFGISVRYPTLVALSCQNFLPRVRPILRVWLSCEVYKNRKGRKKKTTEAIEGSARKWKDNRFTYPPELFLTTLRLLFSICYSGYR